MVSYLEREDIEAWVRTTAQHRALQFLRLRSRKVSCPVVRRRKRSWQAVCFVDCPEVSGSEDDTKDDDVGDSKECHCSDSSWSEESTTGSTTHTVSAVVVMFSNLNSNQPDVAYRQFIVILKFIGFLLLSMAWPSLFGRFYEDVGVLSICMFLFAWLSQGFV